MKAIQELKFVIAERKTKPKRVYFLDEVLWVKNSWLREFLHLYKEHIGIPFTANFRFGPLGESDVKLMAEANAEILFFAAETADEKTRTGLLNKPVKNKMIFKLADMLNRHGIKFSASCFFGLPGETVEDHFKNISFYRKLKPTYLWTTFLQPYAGLPISETPEIMGMTNQGTFGTTLHHEMYLDLPDKKRLANLKKIYFYLLLWPRSKRFFRWLIKFNMPLVFDVLFMLHFTYSIFIFERVSIIQFLHHVRIFALRPLIQSKAY